MEKFKTYLIEGLMLFIAVSLGFLADNLREYIGDRQKEKELVTSLIHNLEDDKNVFKYAIEENEQKLLGLDSLLMMEGKPLFVNKNIAKLYQFSSSISYYSSFLSNSATMSQLKNSGGLNYIKAAHVADSIAYYDMLVNAIYIAEKPYEKAMNNAIESMTEFLIFGQKVVNKNKHVEYKIIEKLKPTEKQTAIFFNKIKLEKGWTFNYLRNLKEKQPYNHRLIQLLKKEYNL